MRRLRFEICSVDGQIVAASCVEGIAPLRGMWQVFRTGPTSVGEVQAQVALMIASIPTHKKQMEVPTGKPSKKVKNHG